MNQARSVLLAILAIVASSGVAQAALADHPVASPEQGWLTLFNGKDLTGWTVRDVTTWKRRADGWAVEDGALTRKTGGYLVSDGQYADFILDLEFKAIEKTNSGVFLRHVPQPGVKPYWRDGVLEIQVFGSRGGSQPTKHDCGALYDMVAPGRDMTKKLGEWNRMTITAQGSRIAVVLNGHEVIDADLDRWTEAGKNPDGTPNKYAKPMREMSRRGYIMLQDHGTPVWYRNVRIKELASPQGQPEHARVPNGAVDPFQQNKRLGRGVNIIGYDPLWKSRDKGRFKEQHFRLIKDAGFQHVRINLHPWRDGKIDAQNRLAADWLATLDWAVRQCQANKLLAILDLHEFQEMGREAEGNRERFLATWRQLAERYRDAPADVLFEVLNEPNKRLTPELWNGYLRDALAIIRKSNPTRTVIVGPAFWNNIDALDKLVLPEEDRNLIVTVHYYKPMAFTHQGASWTGQKNKLGVPWNGTAEDLAAIRRDFDKAQAWAAQHNRPIYLGEFGAYDKADMASRLRYIEAVAREAEKHGWSWGYWQFDGDFIVFDMKTQQWVEPILRALIAGRE